MGQYASALPDLEESLAQLQALGLQQQLAETYIHLSCCFYGLGRIAEGETSVGQAIAIGQHIDSPTLQGLILRCRALYAPQTQVIELIKQALTLAQQHNSRLDEARCLLRLAVLTSDGPRDELWAKGTAIMHEIGAATWLEGRSLDKPPIIALIL